MSFPSKTVVPQSGYIHGVVQQRDALYLSILIEFEPVLYGAKHWTCALAIDRIPFNGGAWPNLGTLDFNDPIVQSTMQTAFVMEKSDRCHNVSLTITPVEADQFRVQVETLVNFTGFVDGEVEPNLPVSADLIIPFIGISLHCDNFSPKPSEPEHAQNIVAALSDLTTLHPPFIEQDHAVFRPIIDRQPDLATMQAIGQPLAALEDFDQAPDATPITLEAITQLELAIEQAYYPFVPNTLTKRCRFPADYVALLLQLNRRYSKYGMFGFAWRKPDEVFENTCYGWDLNADFLDPEMGTLRLQPDMWVDIAHYSSKAIIFLCCSPESKYYGQVLDCNDDHPWWYLRRFDTDEAIPLREYIEKFDDDDDDEWYDL